MPLLSPVKYRPGEYIWEAMDYSSNIIFLVEGEVDFFVENTIVDKEDENFDQETIKRNEILKTLKK